MANGDIFSEVQQRVAAFRYWKEFWREDAHNSYGKISEDEYLDEAYRFLNFGMERLHAAVHRGA